MGVADVGECAGNDCLACGPRVKPTDGDGPARCGGIGDVTVTVAVDAVCSRSTRAGDWVATSPRRPGRLRSVAWRPPGGPQRARDRQPGRRSGPRTASLCYPEPSVSTSEPTDAPVAGAIRRMSPDLPCVLVDPIEVVPHVEPGWFRLHPGDRNRPAGTTGRSTSPSDVHASTPDPGIANRMHLLRVRAPPGSIRRLTDRDRALPATGRSAAPALSTWRGYLVTRTSPGAGKVPSSAYLCCSG